MKRILLFTPDRARNNALGTGRPRRAFQLGLHLALAASLAALTLLPIGCGSGSSTTKTVPPPVPNASQLYFSPLMGNDSQATYAIDLTANTFVRSTYGANGATITDSGDISLLPNGILSLEATYLEGTNGSISLQTPVQGGWAVELANQAALVDLATPTTMLSNGDSIPGTNYFAPAVPTQSCPNLTTAEAFQFVTIPERLAPSTATTIALGTWNPQLETAYGSVKVSTSGNKVSFASVSQFTLPTVGGGSAPSTPAPASQSAVCAATYYGNVISVPSTDTVTNPGGSEGISPAATIGIGPSGFLVEDAGSSTLSGQPYANVLGAGYGAVGVPTPASDITSSLVSAQLQGFLYAPGVAPAAFTYVASFGGYANPQTSCSSLLGQLTAAGITPSANTVYGGEYAINVATPTPVGTGNCDLAVDLGTQASNGLYTSATVYVGSSFPGNGNGALYSFPAVTVAGQLNGKDALVLIGADTTGTPSRAWGVYLLQSN